jgi:carbonic anhydrase
MPFEDILTANSEYAKNHEFLGNGRARRGLAIVTCIDSRIDPLASFGLKPGDAKILRNAGARVTDDVLRTLILAAHVLGVNRVALIQHTDCGGTKVDQAKMETIVGDLTGEDASGIDFLTVTDQIATLHEDAQRIRDCALMPAGTEVGEFMYDVENGRLTAVG